MATAMRSTKLLGRHFGTHWHSYIRILQSYYVHSMITSVDFLDICDPSSQSLILFSLILFSFVSHPTKTIFTAKYLSSSASNVADSATVRNQNTPACYFLLSFDGDTSSVRSVQLGEISDSQLETARRPRAVIPRAMDASVSNLKGEPLHGVISLARNSAKKLCE